MVYRIQNKCRNNIKFAATAFTGCNIAILAIKTPMMAKMAQAAKEREEHTRKLREELLKVSTLENERACVEWQGVMAMCS